MTESFSLRNKKVWVAGHNGMVGAATVRRLAREECCILTMERSALDLRAQADTQDWLAEHRPDVVIVAAAKVGGILANDTYPADFLYDNLMIEANIIRASFKAGVKKLLFLGSSCIYPREAEQPIKEEALLTAPLEQTNEWYAVAKIAGIKLCQAYRKQHGCDFIAAMPCNLYGPGDTYDEQNSHVIPALLMKMHKAKREGAAQVVLWGTGMPLREFMHVDDLADALVFLLKHYSDASPVNTGSGGEVSIRDLAGEIAQTVGYKGNILFDPEKPDGTPRKLMDSSRLHALGWQPRISLSDGLLQVYQDYLDRLEVQDAA